MAGHTPGPWFVNPAKAWVEVPDKDAPICAMLWPTELRSEDETFANASLIAAAPELLKAAELVLAGLNERIDSAPVGSAPVFAGIAALHDAIAKAHGS